MLGYNLFLYCGNNPLRFSDDEGTFWDIAIDVVFTIGSVINVIQNPTSGKAGELASGITKNTTRIYDNLVSGAKYRISDGLTSTTLSEVKNYSGTLSYTAQLRDFVSYSLAHGLKMQLYTNANLSKPLQRLVDDNIIEVLPILF